MEYPDFLKKKYDLHNAPEVEVAAKRAEKRTGEKVPQDPEARIQNYLDRFKEIIERKEPAKRERGIEALKQILHDKFVIKPEEIPEGYFENQRRLAREQGHGDIEIADETKNQLAEVIITDQKNSLDNWIDYFSSSDATYPDWLKYYAFRSILGMGEYDKEKKQFSKRSKGTVKPFPDINREALACVLDAIEKKYQGKVNAQDPEFKKLLQTENFAKLYAFAIDKVTPASEEALVNSLQRHGTGWCTAGELTAKAQLKAGDFYVYYSYDENGKPNIPRAAIRMQGNQIAEVRGIAHEQNLDPYVNDIVKAKLSEFPDGKIYEKKSQDMKLLTEIENKTQARQLLTKSDLLFLYEINEPIEGFGYQRDPRIEEIRKTRNPQEDAPIVFECEPNQIARKPEEINENTKVYLGHLFKGIFQTNIEHIGTSFPEGMVKKMEAEITGKSGEELEKELKSKNINISDYASDMLEKLSPSSPEHLDLVRLTVKDFGFPNGATTDEIYQKAEELGLELCPQDTGPNLRLQNSTPDYMYIAMKQISDRDGSPSVFYLSRRAGGLWLDYYWAKSDDRWHVSSKFVFRLRKLET